MPSRPSRNIDTSSAQFNSTRSSRPRGRSRSYSRSPSQDSAGSKDIDEMLLEATSDNRRQLSRSSMPHHRGGGGGGSDYHLSYRPDSPSSEYPGHLHPSSHLYARTRGTHSLPHLDAHPPGSGGPPGVSVMSGPAMHPDNTGPLQQPGQVQTYQTHIFAPPVTGAPVKKSKFMSGSTGGAAAGAATSASGSGSVQG